MHGGRPIIWGGLFICYWAQQMVADQDYGFGSASRDNAARHSKAMIETGLQQLTPLTTHGKGFDR